MAPPLCFIPASQRRISIMSPYLTVHLHACLSSFVIHHKQVSLLRISGWFTILWYFHRGDEEKMYIGNTSANCSGNPPLIFLFSTLLTGVIAPPPHFLSHHSAQMGRVLPFHREEPGDRSQVTRLTSKYFFFPVEPFHRTFPTFLK